MPNTIGDLWVKIKANDAEFFNSTTRMKKAAVALGGVLAGAFAVDKIRDFGIASVKEFSNAEAVWNRLGSTVNATGTQFSSVRGKIEAAANSMQRATTVGDEDFAAALQRLTLQTRDVNKALGVMDVVADLAAAGQMDTASAADLLGKALAGNTTQLTRMFPALKGSTDLLGDLRKMIGSAAEDEVKTLDGATRQLTGAWGNFKESIGRGLAGGESSIDTINNLTKAVQGLADWIDGHSGMFEDFRSEIATFASKTATEAETIARAWQKIIDKWTEAGDAWRRFIIARAPGTDGEMWLGAGAGRSWGAAPAKGNGKGGGGGGVIDLSGGARSAGGGAGGPSGKLLRKILAGNALPEDFARLATMAREGFTGPKGPTTPITFGGKVIGAIPNITAPGGVRVPNAPGQSGGLTGPGRLGSMLGELTSGFSSMLSVLSPVSLALQAFQLPIQIISDLLVEKLAKAVSFLTQGIGWTVRAIGKAVNFLLPGNPANGLVKFGQEMIDQAKAVRSATDATNAFTEALSNVPRIVNLAAIRRGVARGGGVGGGGSGGYGGGPTGPAKPYNPPIIIQGDLVLQGVQDLDGLGRAASRKLSRGGAVRLAFSG